MGVVTIFCTTAFLNIDVISSDYHKSSSVLVAPIASHRRIVNRDLNWSVVAFGHSGLKLRVRSQISTSSIPREIADDIWLVAGRCGINKIRLFTKELIECRVLMAVSGSVDDTYALIKQMVLPLRRRKMAWA